VREGNTHSERPPHLEVGPFRLWVHGRERPDCDDAWDGNWLYVTARCGGVSVRGPVLETVAVARLRRELARLQETLSGEAVLDSLEPQLSLRLEASDRLGHIAVRIEITPDHLSEGHWFAYELDQSYLPQMLRQCDAILAEHPVRDAEARGV
jgi:hypothetical protein